MENLIAALLGFVSNILLNKLNSRRKLKILLYENYELIMKEGELQEVVSYYVIRIVNVGSSKVYFEPPMFQLSPYKIYHRLKKTGIFQNAGVAKGDTELLEGMSKTYRIPRSYYAGTQPVNICDSPIRVLVRETKGNIFKSKWQNFKSENYCKDEQITTDNIF